MKRKSAIKSDLFADQHHLQKIDKLRDLPLSIEHHIDLAKLAAQIEAVAPPVESFKCGRLPYSIEMMVRILVLKRLYSLSDEKVKHQLLGRISYKRFCGVTDLSTISERTTVWIFENRVGGGGVKSRFEGMELQSFTKAFIPRCGQIIVATLMQAPIQHNSRDEKKMLDERAIPPDWELAKRRQKDTDVTWAKKHDKSYHGYKLTINVDTKHKIIRKIETSMVSGHDSKHFEDTIDPFNTSCDVYTERGYPSKARDA